MDGSKFDDIARALGQGTSRRTVLRGIAGGLAGILTGGVVARPGVGAADRTLTICHATGDPEAPYQTMNIQQAEMNQHARHGDFLRVECCVDSDCANLAGVCGSGTCQTGYCVQLPNAAGTACDDGLACTTNPVCDGAFTCVGNPVICAETENACTTAVCSEEGQGCQEVPFADGTACAASDACADFVCSSGTCTEVPKTDCTGNCADCGGVCVDLNSDPDHCQTCGHSCDDGNVCTTETCQAGACVGGPAIVCPTGQICDALMGCVCSSDAGCPAGYACFHGGCFLLNPSDTSQFCVDRCGPSGIAILGGNFVCVSVPGTSCSSDAGCPIGQACYANVLCVAPC